MLQRSDREDAERRIAKLNIDPTEEAATLRRLPTDATLEDALALLPAAP